MRNSDRRPAVAGRVRHVEEVATRERVLDAHDVAAAVGSGARGYALAGRRRARPRLCLRRGRAPARRSSRPGSALPGPAPAERPGVPGLGEAGVVLVARHIGDRRVRGSGYVEPFSRAPSPPACPRAGTTRRGGCRVVIRPNRVRTREAARLVPTRSEIPVREDRRARPRSSSRGSARVMHAARLGPPEHGGVDRRSTATVGAREARPGVAPARRSAAAVVVAAACGGVAASRRPASPPCRAPRPARVRAAVGHAGRLREVHDDRQRRRGGAAPSAPIARS